LIKRFSPRLLLTVCGLGVVLSGCGYSATRLLPPNYRMIYVEPFENKIGITEETSERVGFQTNIPGLEEQITRAVIDRFLLDGNLRVTNKKESADLVMDGKLLDFFRQVVRSATNDSKTAEEYRLNLVASLAVRDREGKLIVDETNLVGDTSYFVTGSSATSESTAINTLITDFARRVVERVIENW